MTKQAAQPTPPSNIARRRDAARTGNGDVYQGRRGEILKAAAAVFQERGVARSTLDDVAQRVGLDRASLYYYFGSKDQLVEELLGFAVERNVLTAEEIAVSGGDAQDKLRRAITAMLTSYAEHYPYLYIFVNEYLSGARTSADSEWMQQARDMAHRYDLAIRKIVADGIDQGRFREITDATTVARAVVGMVNSTSTWFRPTAPEQAERLAEIFSTMILNGIASAPPLHD
jgi:AcrR family transcriptional regulator